MGVTMQTLILVLLSLFAYTVIIFAFLRFFSHLSDRDAEIRHMLISRRQRKRTPVSKRKLRLARG